MAGELIALIFIQFFFTTAYGIPYYIGSFGSAVMPETPIRCRSCFSSWPSPSRLYYGIESVARSTEVFNKNFHVFIYHVHDSRSAEHTAGVSFPDFGGRYSAGPQRFGLLSAFVSVQNITVLMLYPIASRTKKGEKSSSKGFLWANGMVVVNLLMAILVLGEGVVANSSFATILLTREVYILPVITRIDYFISAIWVLSEFASASFIFTPRSWLCPSFWA
jgi:hypothetical protein